MAIKLQVRRDTLTNWNNNPTVVLLSGEIGYVTTTRNMKIGDGLTQWQYLPYEAPYYTGSTSVITPNLSVDLTNNRVGIGTSSPSSLLHVAGTVSYGSASTPSTLAHDGSNNAVANGYNGHVFQVGGTERARISSSGNVGIGTNNPSNQLHIEGTAPAIRLKDTTSGTAEYSLIDGDSSAGSIRIGANPGNVAAVAASASIKLNVNGTERLNANDNGVQVTGTTSSTGLITATGGLTVPFGGTLTVASGGSIALPTTSLNGSSLTANSVALTAVAQVAATTILGNSGGTTGNVVALTAGSGGTARTALGLGTAAYTTAGASIDSTTFVNLSSNFSSVSTININTSSMTIGQKYACKISLARSTGGNQVTLTVTNGANHTTLIQSASVDSTNTVPFGTSGNTISWFGDDGTALGTSARTISPYVMSTSVSTTYNILRWFGPQGTSTNYVVGGWIVFERFA